MPICNYTTLEHLIMKWQHHRLRLADAHFYVNYSLKKLTKIDQTFINSSGDYRELKLDWWQKLKEMTMRKWYTYDGSYFSQSSMICNHFKSIFCAKEDMLSFPAIVLDPFYTSNFPILSISEYAPNETDASPFSKYKSIN